MKSLSIEKSHPNVNMMVIGRNLTALRKSKGLTRAAVAYHSEISISTLYRLEKGECGKIGIGYLSDVCKYYGVELNSLFI